MSQIKQLNQEAPKTVYLLDSDKGGEKIRKKLETAGIVGDHIFSIPKARNQGLEVEDIVDSTVFLAAVNEELRSYNGADVFFLKNELPTVDRVQAIKSWCEKEGLKPPNKRAVAYRIVESRNTRPILSSQYRKSLQKLYQDVTAALREVKE